MIDDRLGALLGELQILLVGAECIGMTFDHDPAFWEHADCVFQSHQDVGVLRLQICGSTI